MPEFLWTTQESALRRALLAPLWLAEGPYRLGAFLHRLVYDRGLGRRVRLPARVLSVGNLTVGGSGKTPLVAWLAARLQARGQKVAILSRGVGGRRGAQVNVVSDGKRVLLAPADVGDEPVWLASSVPGVAVLAGRNRVALGLRAAAVFGAELLILDDGFQHHRLQRDLDLVCIDAGSGLGNGHVLPRGPLREPCSALGAANAIIWTRAPDEGQVEDARVPAQIPSFCVQIVPRGLRPLGARRLEPCEALRGTQVGMLAALARPDRLCRQLQSLGAEVAARATFPDHHLYRRAELQGLDPGLTWITTAKDAVKIPLSWSHGRRILVLEEEVRDRSRTPLVDWILERLGGAGASA